MINKGKNKRLLMVIGAGRGQLPAILAGKKIGLRVIAVDKNSEAVGMKHADIALPIDIIDVEKTLFAAEKYKVDGVMTMQSDFGVPAVGKIVETLCLSGVSYQAALKSSDKWESKKCFFDKKIATPSAGLAKNYKEAKVLVEKIGPPCIIKPADSSASRGVSKIDRISQLKESFEKALEYSLKNKVCVEQYIDSLELGAQTFSKNGKCVAVFVHNDTLSDLPYYIPIGHSFPSKLERKILDRVKKECRKAVEALGINDGPANIDVILDKKGNPFIVEVGARIGATCLPELMYYHTGIDWVKEAVKIAVGMRPDLKVTKKMPCAALILDSPKDGVLRDYKIPEKVKNLDDLLEMEVSVKIGEKVNRLTMGTDRIGKIVVRGDDVGGAEEKARWVKSQIKLFIDGGVK